MEEHFLDGGAEAELPREEKVVPGVEELKIEATTCVILSTEMPASAIAERALEMASARSTTRKRSDMASIEGAVGSEMVHQKKLPLSEL
jgi:hypothetical protein